MIRCPHNDRLQDLLDGLLDAPQEAEVRRHALACAECATELALYERVFAELAAAPTWDPGPALTARILDRVLPSRVRSRWVRALGWGYGLAAAGSVAGVTALVSNPDSRALMASLGGAASHRVLQAAVFVLDALAMAAVQLSTGFQILEAFGARFAPLVRALDALLSRPGVNLTLLSATLAVGALLWWLRPREAHARHVRSHREIGHVGLLGF